MSLESGSLGFLSMKPMSGYVIKKLLREVEERFTQSRYTLVELVGPSLSVRSMGAAMGLYARVRVL